MVRLGWLSQSIRSFVSPSLSNELAKHQFASSLSGEQNQLTFFFKKRKVMLTETAQGRNAGMQNLGKGASPEEEDR